MYFPVIVAASLLIYFANNVQIDESSSNLRGVLKQYKKMD